MRSNRLNCLPLALCLPWVAPAASTFAADLQSGLNHTRLAAIRTAGSATISPNGQWIAFLHSVPRNPGIDKDGPAWSELHVVPFAGGEARVYVGGEVNVSAPRFTPNSDEIAYLAKRGDDEKQALWSIPVAGGESRKLIGFEESIDSYEISPDGGRAAFIAVEPKSETQKAQEEKGYKQEVFEEDWRPRRLLVAQLPPLRVEQTDPATIASESAEQADDPRVVELDGSAFDVRWSPDGSRLAVTLAASPLIDDRYMNRRVHVIDGEGKVLARIDNPGKLEGFEFSPDGSRIAMITADDPNDPSPGRLKVAPSAGGALVDLLPKFDGQVRRLGWQNAETVMFVADEGVESILGEIELQSSTPRIHARSGDGVPILTEFSISALGSRVALIGHASDHPAELFAMAHGDAAPRRLTHSNRWLDDVRLGRQEVLRWTASDGLELEGLLIRPLQGEGPAPLLLMVHGGPESHDANGWLTSYSRPGQLAAAEGYAVLYPNYRGSTGRGVAFSKLGQGDAAGKEFDDLVDAVDRLVELGIADGDRVGVTGGSYGGYATAWCATRHSQRFRAGVMFVGISNKISKALTTEIPVEDRMVHTLFDPWTRWQFSLERSPIFHAEASRTALLIAHGQDDSRVHPSQSLQLYRALKLIGKTPVRYIRYPGEGHGNRHAAARDDYSRRLMRWMNHFVRDRKDGMPSREAMGPAISDDENSDEQRHREPDALG